MLILARIAAAAMTTAALAKTFVPFYLIGSTAIFAGTSVLGAAFLAATWRGVYEMARKALDVFLGLAAFYSLVVVSFLMHSRPIVPTTHLVGIVIFHSLFLVFGFSAARALNVVLLILLTAATAYFLVIIQYAARFGDLMKGGYLQDIFGVGNPEISATFHQNLGLILGLAALAALGLASNGLKRALAVGALPIVLLFMFYIAARGALVALIAGLLFLIGADLWVRSKKRALLSMTAMVVTGILASSVFYHRALQNITVDPVATDAISRTIQEIQDPRPGFRMQIWARAWHRISSEPSRLLFGRGIGIYPVDEGFGAPDWLLHPTEGSRHYPHSVHLEVLYETGIVGLLLFCVLSIWPLIVAVGRWTVFSGPERSSVALYVFILVNSEISGAFAYTYILQFFLALNFGIIALKRAKDAEALLGAG